VKTAKFGHELVKNMTVRLGYANVKIWLCANCPDPQCYSSSNSKVTQGSCKFCDAPLRLVRHLSFVDCPGHEQLMATMLNGSAVMDGAILLVAANEKCPQDQAKQHIAALEIKGLKTVCVVQNKVDLVNRDVAEQNFRAIRSYAASKAPSLINTPIIPVSAQHRLNMDSVCKILGNLPIPQHDLSQDLFMVVVRSFDINKPGQENISEIHGGVAGGSILKGSLSVGTRVEIRPGLVTSKNGSISCSPLFTKVISISSEQTKLQSAIPGGLIGVATTLDPSITKGDDLVGQVIGIPGRMPPVFHVIVVRYEPIDVSLGKPSPDTPRFRKGARVQVNVNSLTTEGAVTAVQPSGNTSIASIRLDLPCCAHVQQKITISLKPKEKWTLTGLGTILPQSSPMSLGKVNVSGDK